MKNINRLLTLIIIFGFIFTACDELDDPAGLRNPIDASPAIENLDPTFFIADDKENTFVTFDVTSGDVDEVMETLIEVSYDGGRQRAALVELTTPATGVEVALTDVATALGKSLDDMEGGAYVNLEVLRKAGNEYFRSTAAVNALIACPYVQDGFAGTPNAESSGWNVSGEVTITLDPTDNTILYLAGLADIDGCGEDAGPLPLIIDPITLTISVPRTILATSEGWFADYYGETNIAYGGTGTVNTCTHDMHLELEISTDQYNYGVYGFDIVY